MATAAAPQRAPAHGTRFFLIMALVMATVIIAGFSLNLAMGRSSFAAPWPYHVHGMIFMGWLGLYLAQVITISTGNIALHRQLGKFAYVWIPAMVAAGLMIILVAVRGSGGPFFFAQNEFLISNMAGLLVFCLHRIGGAQDQLGQPVAGVVTQQLHLGQFAPGLDPRGQLLGQSSSQLGAVERGLRRHAAPAGRAIAVRCVRLSFVEQRVEFGGDELARFAPQQQQFARIGGAVQSHAARDPAQVGIGAGQQVGLLVVEKLDAVLEPAQKDVGLGQPGRAGRLHQPALGQLGERLER